MSMPAECFPNSTGINIVDDVLDNRILTAVLVNRILTAELEEQRIPQDEG